jgi:hypothetical protein
LRCSRDCPRRSRRTIALPPGGKHGRSGPSDFRTEVLSLLGPSLAHNLGHEPHERRLWTESGPSRRKAQEAAIGGCTLGRCRNAPCYGCVFAARHGPAQNSIF